MEIDVQSVLREKPGEQMEQYGILEACNLPLAHRALPADRSVGLLLPRIAGVRDAGDGTIVEALNSRAIAEVAGQPLLRDIANEAAARLRAALRTLQPRR